MKTERRAVPRFRDKLAIQIEMDDYRFEAISTEVSAYGIRALCKGSISNKVFHRYIQVTPGENITANIQIKTLNAQGLDDTLSCLARVIAVNRVSQDSYIVGFNITRFESDGQQQWQDYITAKH